VPGLPGEGLIMTTTYHQEIVCVDCAKKFWFTNGEQKFFAARQLDPPKRCPPCRRARRRRLEALEGTAQPSVDRTIAEPDTTWAPRTRISQPWR
jgi:hypothetical protein